MLNKLLQSVKQYQMLQPGDKVICAVSGGADSMALLWGMYLLRDKLDIHLSAAHYNHHLRGKESDRDEQFVKEFCDRFEIPLHLGGGQITAGEKGLEAAARDARYAFLNSLPGKIATAHTADDNAETVLMRLIRGSGLKGLGAIAPVNGRVIRPMLAVTRTEVETFLGEYYIDHIEDSSNETNQFLRNRVRHHLMPVLNRENPRLAENLSAMALRLRQDEQALCELAVVQKTDRIEPLRAMHPAIRSRVLEQFLKENGVREPEAEHIALAEALVFSAKPSAQADFPGNVTIGRQYDRLTRICREVALPETELCCPGVTEIQAAGLRVSCEPALTIENTRDVFTVHPDGQLVLRSRQAGDTMRFPGGTKSLKKRFADEKIPAAQRMLIPVISDEAGVLAVYGMGTNLDRRASELPAVRIRVEKT